MREFLRKCRYFFKYAFFFSLFINILQLTFPVYMLQVYDKVLTSYNVATLYVITIAAVIALAVMSLLSWIRSRLLVRAGVEFDRLLSGDVLHRNLDEAGQPNPEPGASNATLGDVATLRNFLGGSAVFCFFDIPWMPIYFLLIFLLHPALGWVSIAGGIAIFILGVLTERVSRKRLANATTLNSYAHNFTGMAMRNAGIVRSMGMLGNITDRWGKINNAVISLQTNASNGAGLLNSVTSALRMGMQVIIYFVGAYLTVKQECTAGVMIAASIIMGRAVGPISQFMATYRMSINAWNSYNKLDKFLANPKPAPNMALPDPVGEISCENLYFSISGRPVIKGITFRMPAGQSLAIIGPSAAGKSTLCKLLLNLWTPTAGKVRIDRADIKSWNMEKLGPFLGYLPQDVELFSGTVAENIARLGDVDSAKVIRAANLAGCHEMVLNLPRGYDTQMGDAGRALSGGQRQRIGLARALYGDPRIIVLDEPNANLDEEGEASLAKAIINLRQVKATVIMVTHKPQILNLVDNIMVMQDGQVAMCGARNVVLGQLAKMQAEQRAKAQQAAREAQLAKERLEEQRNKLASQQDEPTPPAPKNDGENGETIDAETV